MLRRPSIGGPGLAVRRLAVKSNQSINRGEAPGGIPLLSLRLLALACLLALALVPQVSDGGQRGVCGVKAGLPVLARPKNRARRIKQSTSFIG